MGKKLNTLVKTDVIQLGFCDLYEPKAFKDDNDKKDDNASADKTTGEQSKEQKDDNKNKPKFRVSVMFDKDNEEHMRTVRLLSVGQSNAMKNAVLSNTWAKSTKDSAKRALQNCDEYVQTYGTGKNAKQMVVADKYPERAKHWQFSASSSAKRRPAVYYLSPAGTFEKLPDPILNPETDEERAEALRIEALWNKWVYAGQNARLGVSFSAWTNPTGAGVSSNLEAVFILGGGTRLGGYSFNEIFNAADLADASAWLSKHAPSFDADSNSMSTPAIEDDDASDVETVDEETGEITPEPEPRAKRKTTRRKVKASVQKPEPVSEPDEADDDSEFDDEEEIW